MLSFKKISAIGASALMVGLTMGTAAAANYPAPFVVGGAADVAVVYGTGSGVSVLDAVEAGNLQSNLQSFMGSGSSSSSTSTSGETTSLDTSATRIWLNTSLNTAKSTITKTDLPTTLGDSTFSGNVDATLTHTIKLQSGVKGTSTNNENSGRVVFAKQPKSNNDPVVGISLADGTNANRVLYNATATFKAINFTHTDTEGETIKLFGKEYVVSTATDTTELVLFSSAQQTTLTKTAGTTPSVTVSISGVDHTIELLNGDSTTATISIDGTSGTITEGNSKKISGVEVAVKDVTSSDAGGITATLLIGSEKLTFTHGSTVTKGADEDPIDGTRAYITGRTIAATELTVAVFRPDSSNDAITPGSSFEDPVFGSFKVDFSGISSAFDDTTRDLITVQSSGDDSMTLTMIDADGNAGTVDFAHNQSGQWRLGDDSNNTIHVREMANISQDEYVILGNEDYGHVLEVTDLFNSSNGDHTKHRAKFRDKFSGETHETTFTSDTAGTVIIDGKTYTVTFHPGATTSRIEVKYPTSDSANAGTIVLYPTFQTQRGAKVALYEPLVLNLAAIDQAGTDASSISFPDGDGYTSVAIDYDEGVKAGQSVNASWLIGTVPVSLNGSGTSNKTTVTIGALTYNFTNDPRTVNLTKVYLVDPEGNANVDQPAVIVFNEKDDQSEYEAVVIDLESDPGATSANGVGVNDILGTAKGTDKYWAEASKASDSDITEIVDWWGSLMTLNADDSDQKKATISYADNQVYSIVYLGASGSSVSSTATGSAASQLGDVLVKDTEVSSVSSKNLVVVGGSCINSVAANVLGGAYCGAAFTEKTGVGSGEFLIQSLASPYSASKIALVVAGYEVSDTVNAAKYLRTQTVDTASSKKYKGTTSTSAQLVVE